MKTDRIFVLLLVVMLPMSGCFDDAVGDAEGADDANAGTTVINNYYNNTTNVIQETLDMIAIGGYIPPSAAPTNESEDTFIRDELTTINTTAGQMLRFHEYDVEFSPRSYSTNSYLTIDTTCVNGASWVGYVGGDEPGSAFDCNHVIQVNTAAGSDVSWSIVYSLVTVTVG